MQILFEHKSEVSPKLSIVLLDWSCRESFHILEYLKNQIIPRNQYEIIWIEYYSRCSSEIKIALEECKKLSKPPLIDKWIVMNMPENYYYHKHLMYNVGAIAAKGKIVTFCDSDAIVTPTFAQSIIRAFEKDSNIVLHLDEVRNIQKKFYPFNFPSIEEITGDGCINFRNGKTTGLRDNSDPIHIRNYGACMCALRQDIINIGGADEHIDYLGHICGPYDMTFRLVNAGKKEVWHQNEFLYHVWHPGTDGRGNYIGPHDGQHMSTRALESIKTKRITPYMENPSIRILRLNKNSDESELLFLAVSKERTSRWVIPKDIKVFSIIRKYQKAAKNVFSYERWSCYIKVKCKKGLNFILKVKRYSNCKASTSLDYAWKNMRMGKFNNAVDCFNLIISSENNLGNNSLQKVFEGRGWANYHLGNFRQAVADFNEALKSAEKSNHSLLQNIYKGRSRAYYRIGKTIEALNDFKKYKTNLPENKCILRFYLILQIYAAVIKQQWIKIGQLLDVGCSVFVKVIEKILVRLNNQTINEIVDNSKTVYPLDIAFASIRPDLDILLLELPPRYMPFMPNGLGYVYNILLKCGVSFQTIDTNIVLYHRYHEQRIREKTDSITTFGGYKMVMDPWDNTNMGEWDRSEVINYFLMQLTEIIDGIVWSKPKALGISLNGSNRTLAKRFIEIIRQKVPGVVIIVGGYDCIYYKTAKYLVSDFDYMVIGEAETKLESLVQAVARGERPKDLSGIVSRFDSPGRIWINAPLVEDLDLLDFPKYQWANLCWYQTYNRQHLIPISASRGCNWSRCRFCGECIKFRHRIPEKVADEVEYYANMGWHTFHFNESDVNGAPQALYDFCTEIIRRNLKVKLVAQLRIDKRNTAEYFQHLAKAGFTHLRFGVDGWTDRLIRLQNKGYTMDLVFKNLHDCYAAGITTTVNMVIGVPGETEEDVKEAIMNVSKCKNCISEIASFNTLILTHGSEYYNYPDKYKIILHGDKNEIYKKNVYYIPPELWHSEEPYIDQQLRMNRLDRIASELYKNGINIGGFASKVVENLRKDYSSVAK